jgi:hypothetical protein
VPLGDGKENGFAEKATTRQLFSSDNGRPRLHSPDEGERQEISEMLMDVRRSFPAPKRNESQISSVILSILRTRKVVFID